MVFKPLHGRFRIYNAHSQPIPLRLVHESCSNRWIKYNIYMLSYVDVTDEYLHLPWHITKVRGPANGLLKGRIQSPWLVWSVADATDCTILSIIHTCQLIGRSPICDFPAKHSAYERDQMKAMTKVITSGAHSTWRTRNPIIRSELLISMYNTFRKLISNDRPWRWFQYNQ